MTNPPLPRPLSGLTWGRGLGFTLIVGLGNKPIIVLVGIIVIGNNWPIIGMIIMIHGSMFCGLDISICHIVLKFELNCAIKLPNRMYTTIE